MLFVLCSQAKVPCNMYLAPAHENSGFLALGAGVDMATGVDIG